MPAKLDDLLIGLEAVGLDGASVYLCRATGEVLIEHENFDQFEKLPDDLDDETKYIMLPGKRDLGLSKPLVLAFARLHLTDDFDDVREMFSHRGAYRRFQDLLRHRNARDRWHAFEAAETERALRQWCEESKIELGE